MEFNDLSVALREICNGMMTVSAVILLAILVRYVVRWVPRLKGRWHRDAGVQIALAGIVMVSGHVIRSAGGWLQFLMFRWGWDVNDLVNSFEYFIVATILVVTGKAMVVFFFINKHALRRFWYTATMLVASVSIPLGIFLVL